MIGNPVVGNTYRVVGNKNDSKQEYHYVEIGELVVCEDSSRVPDMWEYSAVSSGLKQFIYNRDLAQLVTPTPETICMVYESILQWAEDRNLLSGSTRKDQMVKLVEEIGELAAGIAKGKEDLVKDSLGDALVVLTILAKQSGTSIEECLNLAWNEIKDRKGKMVDGIFIKEE